MRNSIKAAVAAIALSAMGLAQTTAAMASEQEYTVVNTNGSVSIPQVWTAVAGDPDSPWTPANMSYAIAPGSQSTFTLSTGGSCFVDVKVRFSDGDVQTFSNVNVCRGTRLIAA